MILEISNRQELFLPDQEMKEMFEEIIEKTLTYENREENFEVSLSLVTPEEIKELNKQYRGKDRATDVLSFPVEELFQPGEEKILGDIVISTEAVMEQAREYSHSVEREIAYLFLHGLLHLLGYDHLESEDKEKMRKVEKEILSQLEITRN
ncbi:rRNA maturation RNase YbeY [Isachenkonia alkalipeptolytica]|uniref:Endoribonuclease YbeY n=1 Tax=Isachenkonia alkalipeptolytica TaxID=2565777 RepID=A0AA44BEU8_9CLOT|nr:rRNA maturation RNase YbeY [Isachenkonia alkalipeptolytica]NBG89323.1 rRNA maturation RNase YbeY [Isachenkonia alkalipeptolytica]